MKLIETEKYISHVAPKSVYATAEKTFISQMLHAFTDALVSKNALEKKYIFSYHELQKLGMFEVLVIPLEDIELFWDFYPKQIPKDKIPDSATRFTIKLSWSALVVDVRSVSKNACNLSIDLGRTFIIPVYSEEKYINLLPNIQDNQIFGAIGISKISILDEISGEQWADSIQKLLDYQVSFNKEEQGVETICSTKMVRTKKSHRTSYEILVLGKDVVKYLITIAQEI